MLTPFGITIRKQRLDRGLRLLDLAERLGFTPAFVSAIETGKKPIPEGYVAAAARAMSLDMTETRELLAAADQTRAVVRVDHLQGEQREWVAAFARTLETKLEEMPPELIARLKKIIHKSVSGETPFKRKRRGLLVPPASLPALWALAERVRTVFVQPEQVSFPIMDVLEYRLGKFLDGFYLDVCDHEEMGMEEGRVIAGENCIKLREDVYRKAWGGSGRDRFTCCHELLHFLLHRQVVMPRARDDKHPVYRDAEWQADAFAGALLMSARHINGFASVDDAASQCGMSPQAAEVTWAKYRERGAIQTLQ
jgi:transcriptional regulator with XRE-family HTH domain